MYWIEECNGVWQVRKGERVVCILLSREEAERLAQALTQLKIKPSKSIPVLSFL